MLSCERPPPMQSFCQDVPNRPVSSLCPSFIKASLTEEKAVASFPGCPLAPMKNKTGGGEPGTDSHVILWHDDITAIITKVMTQLCSHVIG